MTNDGHVLIVYEHWRDGLEVEHHVYWNISFRRRVCKAEKRVAERNGAMPGHGRWHIPVDRGAARIAGMDLRRLPGIALRLGRHRFPPKPGAGERSPMMGESHQRRPGRGKADPEIHLPKKDIDI
jgi:hypothetical protein